MRIAGAGAKGLTITGALNLEGIKRRADGQPIPQFEATDCVFEEALSLNFAWVDGLWLLACDIPGLDVCHARIEGRLDLSGSTVGAAGDAWAVFADGAVIRGDVRLGVHQGRRFIARGGVSLVAAEIGELEASGAWLVRSDRTALSADRARIRGAVFLKPKSVTFKSDGSVSFVDAEIGAEFSAESADISNPKGFSVLMGGASVKGSVYIFGSKPHGPVRLTGPVSLTGADIGGSLEIRHAIISPSPSDTPEQAVCFDCTDLTVEGALTLADITGAGPVLGRPRGRYILTGARTGRLRDNPDTAWPEPGFLDLDGFTYRAIEVEAGAKGVGETRVEWLDRQFSTPRRSGEFKPQPYEQLAKVLREDGRDDDADLVASRKRTRQITRGSESLPSKIPMCLSYLVGFGYSRTKSLGWALFWWGVGIWWITASLATGDIVFRPVHPGPKEHPMDYVGYWDGARFGRDLKIGPTDPDGCPGVVVPVYALELMLPVADLGQASDCRLESRVSRGDWLQLWRAVYQIVGALLVAVLGVSFTGLIRKD